MLPVISGAGKNANKVIKEEDELHNKGVNSSHSNGSREELQELLALI